MKKMILILAVLAVTAMVFFRTGPEEVTSFTESEIQAYLNLGLHHSRYLDEGDVQAYTPTDVMESQKQPTRVKTRYHAVKHHKPRASTLGFSITPPPGSDWYEKLQDDSLFYVKINDLHTRYVILTEAREVHLKKNIGSLAEIESYVEREKKKDIESPHYKQQNISVHNEDSPAEECVRYNQYYQDHGLQGLKKGSYVNVDTHGLFCLHPDNRKVAIDINYVEKSLSNVQVTAYSSEGETFLASLKFL